MACFPENRNVFKSKTIFYIFNLGMTLILLIEFFLTYFTGIILKDKLIISIK